MRTLYNTPLTLADVAHRYPEGAEPSLIPFIGHYEAGWLSHSAAVFISPTDLLTRCSVGAVPSANITFMSQDLGLSSGLRDVVISTDFDEATGRPIGTTVGGIECELTWEGDKITKRTCTIDRRVGDEMDSGDEFYSELVAHDVKLPMWIHPTLESSYKAVSVSYQDKVTDATEVPDGAVDIEIEEDAPASDDIDYTNKIAKVAFNVIIRNVIIREDGFFLQTVSGDLVKSVEGQYIDPKAAFSLIEENDEFLWEAHTQKITEWVISDVTGAVHHTCTAMASRTLAGNFYCHQNVGLGTIDLLVTVPEEVAISGISYQLSDDVCALTKLVDKVVGHNTTWHKVTDEVKLSIEKSKFSEMPWFAGANTPSGNVVSGTVEKGLTISQQNGAFAYRGKPMLNAMPLDCEEAYAEVAKRNEEAYKLATAIRKKENSNQLVNGFLSHKPVIKQANKNRSKRKKK